MTEPSFPGLNDVERMISIGGGSMPETFDEHVIRHQGRAIRSTSTFDAKGQDDRPELGDGNLHANVEIMEIRKRVLPELDEEFLAKIGATSLDDLHEQMKMTINMQKDRELPKLLEQKVVDALIERFEGEVPEYYVDFMRDNVSRELMAAPPEGGHWPAGLDAQEQRRGREDARRGQPGVN